MPEDEINVSFIQRDCNYLQALEGEIDTSHFGFLHAGHVDPDDVPEDEPVYYTVTNRAPEYHVADAPWGTQYAGYRAAGPGQTYWRFANFLFPFWTQAPNGEFGSHMHARAWVPLDDGHTMFVLHLVEARRCRRMSLPQPAFKDGTPIGGTGRGNKLLPNTTDWLGRWRHGGERGQRLGHRPRGPAAATRSTAASTASTCRTRRSPRAWARSSTTRFEHLAPSDQMITRTRRRLLMAARALARQGRPAARRRGRRGLSRRAQRLLRQRRQEPLAGGLCQAAGRGGASAADALARGGIGAAARAQLTGSRPRALRAAARLAYWKILSQRSSKTSRASVMGITVNLPLSLFNSPRR